MVGLQPGATVRRPPMDSEPAKPKVQLLEDRIRELETIHAQLVAYAEDLNRTYLELRFHLQQMTKLNSVATELARTHSIESCGDVCVRGFVTLFPGISICVYVNGPENNLRHLGQQVNPSLAPWISALDELATKALQEETPQEAQVTTPSGALQLVGMGLHAHEKALGCFVMGVIDRSFSENDVQMIKLLGHSIAVTLENAYLYEETNRLAVTDPATGLHNYRYFRQSLEEEVRRARRLGYCIGAIMADVDYFKAFNDTYGHELGNSMLHAVAVEIAQSLRQTDTVARYGGEEFAAILPGCDAAALARVAEKVRRAVARVTIPIGDDGRTASVTVSVGGAWQSAEEADAESLLRAADLAMYNAKSLGRNRAYVRP